MKEPIHTQFERLFEQYSDVVYRLCLFKTSDVETAQDLTQDVFSRLFEYLQEEDMPRNPKSFIYQMARNRIIDHYRKHTTDSLETWTEAGREFADESYGESHTKTMAEYQMVMDVMQQLDESYREVLYLRLVEDWSVKDIAEQLDITESNVSVRINRGKKQLAKLIS